ncbi:cellulase family glycosylhydrolase [Microbacterium sp. 11MF]|uniref:cellulase family glycosylhydrolase n=1 Tax=Microbacterium sp. 11MF TaxID=1169146 RepID=UPI00037DAD1F|nr:cellulase family glycosylhydrolase [Microbacterium sp. 11MF]
MRIKKWQLFAGGAVVLAGGLTTAIIVSNSFASNGVAPTTRPTAEAQQTPTPTPTPEPQPAPEPQSAPSYGDLVGWDQAGTTTVARVLPQVGDAAAGSVAAYVDAPVVDKQTTVLQSVAKVDAGAQYTFTAQVRSATAFPEPVDAKIVVGDTEIPLPDISAAWSEVTADVRVPAGADTVAVGLVVTGPVRGLGLDAVSLTAVTGGSNAVANGSFEDVKTDDRILNRSLVLPASRPVLAVRLPEGAASWKALDAAGKVAASGKADLSSPISSVDLTGLPQGYYDVSVEAGGTSVSTLLGVVDFDGVEIAKDDRFGVGLHVENGIYAGAADLAASLGIGMARNDVLWRDNETTKGRYDFADHYVDGFARLHAHDIKVLGIVNYGNWLYGNGQVPVSGNAIAAYGKYAAAIADRFDLVGLEVYNEFNHARFNKSSCGTSPRCYVPLLKSVHDQVRKVDPKLPIIAGATARYESDWFDGLWRAGGLRYSDAVSFHPYEVSSKPESLAGIIDEANSSMTANGKTTRPIWITELGSSSKTGGRTVSAQADYLVRTATTALAGGAEKFFWYDLINDDPDPGKHEGNFGMYYQKSKGVAALQPKPVGYAQALMISQLQGRAFAASESVGKGIQSHRFGDEANAVRIVWSPAGKGTMTLKSDVPVAVTNMNGATRSVAPVDGVVTIPVSPRPQFVQTSAAPANATPTPTPTPTVSQAPAE